MPTYTFECLYCTTLIDKYIPLANYIEHIVEHCPVCNTNTGFALVVKPAAFHDWDNASSGRYFEDLSAKGETFHSKSDYVRYLKQHGLREWEPRPGMPANGKG